jgi:hypothetical protein
LVVSKQWLKIAARIARCRWANTRNPAAKRHRGSKWRPSAACRLASRAGQCRGSSPGTAWEL